MLEPKPSPVMLLDLESCLKVIDSHNSDWHRTAEGCFANGKNFVLIFRNDRFHRGNVNGQSIVNWPLEKLDKTSLLGLILHLKDEDFFKLTDAFDNGDSLYFIDQLRGFVPTEEDKFVLYCHVHGIVSKHATYEGAKAAWAEYSDLCSARGFFPEPGVFKWEETGWLAMNPRRIGC